MKIYLIIIALYCLSSYSLVLAEQEEASMPRILFSSNSCHPEHPCRITEMEDIRADIERRWKITPESIRQLCSRPATRTVEDLMGCILKESLNWANSHPGSSIPWIAP